MASTTLSKIRDAIQFSIILMITQLANSDEAGKCPCERGQRYNSSVPTCLPCESGTYNDEQCHGNINCKACARAYRYNHEWLSRECTRVSNSVVKCHRGYYCNIHHPGFPGDCTKCRNCSSEGLHEAKRCDGYSDTSCCPEPDMDIVVNVDGANECHKTCKAGQYFDTFRRMCQQCLDGTFMPESKHRSAFCYSCFDYSNNPDPNMFVTHACNFTHNTQVTCRTGFYLRHPGNSPYFLPECTMCRICARQVHDRFEARPCDKFTDTVCCSEEMMIAVRTDIGFSCERPAVGATESDYESETERVAETQPVNTQTKQVNNPSDAKGGSTIILLLTYPLITLLIISIT